MSKSVKVHALFEEEEIAAKAKKNQAHGQTAPGKTLPQNSAKALDGIDKGNQPGATCQNSDKVQTIDTKKEIAKIAGAVGVTKMTVNNKTELCKNLDTCPKLYKVHALFEEEAWRRSWKSIHQSGKRQQLPIAKHCSKSSQRA